MGGPFSLRCLSPLCSPAGGTGQTQSMRVELLQCSLAGFAAQKNRLVFSLRLMLCLLNQRVAWDASSRPGYSCNTKGQRDFISTLVFVASHEARCRMAAFSIQQTRKPHQTREPRGLSPSGGKTQAKPHIPLRPCAPMARSPGVQGVTPCYTVRVSCSPRRAAFSARRGRMKVERNSSTCWALRPV